jgi:hypothetical protein
MIVGTLIGGQQRVGLTSGSKFFVPSVARAMCTLSRWRADWQTGKRARGRKVQPAGNFWFGKRTKIQLNLVNGILFQKCLLTAGFRLRGGFLVTQQHMFRSPSKKIWRRSIDKESSS